MTRVKICGLTNAADRDVAIDAGADALGFIVDVSVDTPREIDAETAESLVADAPPFVTTVLVTMPSAVQPAARLQEQVGADAIQVHRGLEPDYVAGLRERTTASVIAVIDPDEDDVVEYAMAADALLVDTASEDGGGGTGETHDWVRTANITTNLGTPVILAGGLTPENVGEAVTEVQPYAVDTASGVERDGGRKDPEKVREFVQHAKEAELSE
jgi:phosphoribosylanthranilate isomerase